MPPFDPPLTPTEVAAALSPRYTRLTTLKSGGQGAVFKGALRPAGSKGKSADVALKIYFADAVEERNEREIEALKRLQSPRIVRFRDAGTTQLRAAQCYWLETEFIEGQCLQPRAGNGGLGLAQTARVLANVAEAIESMWALRIVHRDIKPDNIMLRADGSAVVIDLGIARHVELAPITASGNTWGTMGYYSPEQRNAIRSLTCKSDVFALGVVAQECLLGRHPTNGSQERLLRGAPRTLTIAPNIPVAFADLIDAMLSPDPIRRPQPDQVASVAAQFC